MSIPIPDGKRVRFEIGGPDGVPREGTVLEPVRSASSAARRCRCRYIRAEGKAGRMGAQLMAIAAEGKRQRYYLAPTEEHEKGCGRPPPRRRARSRACRATLGFLRTVGYGLTRLGPTSSPTVN